MKMLSPILKVVALLAAAFCVYAWFDVKGRISKAEDEMSVIKGATLAEKAPNAAVVHKENEGRKKQIASFQKRVKGLESDAKKLNDELESERSKNVSAAAEIQKGKSEINSLNSKLKSASRELSNRDATIDNLKKELIAKNELLSKQDDSEALKEKVADLERKLATQQSELNKALEKAKLADMSEKVEIIEIDEATGKKVKRTILKTPYVPTGDIATVIGFNSEKGVLVINKGKNDNIKKLQVVLLKKNGVVIADAIVDAVADDTATLVLNAKSVLPEYIAVNEQFELGAPALALKEEPKEEAKAETATE